MSMQRSHSSKTKRTVSAACAVVLIAALTGCQTPPPSDFGAFLGEEALKKAEQDYRLSPPDVVTITSRRVREINGHTEAIRPDGKITLPLIGPVYVTGKTPEEVSAELEKMAREYYEDADASLRVTAYASKKIFVFGEVSIPGSLPWRGNNTVLNTLALTQPTRLADPHKIQILRPNKDGKLVKRMTIDLNRMVKDGVTEHDAPLLDGDIVYVPANPLAALGLMAQQVLLPIQPAASTVSGPANIAADLRTRPYGSEQQNR